jgi:hypothetical protein
MTTYREIEALLGLLEQTNERIYEFDYAEHPHPHVAGELQMATSCHRDLAIQLLVDDEISDQERKWAALFTQRGDSIWIDDWFNEHDVSRWPALLEHARCLHALRVAFTRVGVDGLEGRPEKRPWRVHGKIATDDALKELIATIAGTNASSLDHGANFTVVEELSSMVGHYVELASKIVTDSGLSPLEEEWVLAPLFIKDPIWVTSTEQEIDLSAWPELLDYARSLKWLAVMMWARYYRRG